MVEGGRESNVERCQAAPEGTLGLTPATSGGIASLSTNDLCGLILARSSVAGCPLLVVGCDRHDLC